MQASRRNCLYALFALACMCAAAPQVCAETLTITSTPPGATVEIDGVVVGTTPYKVKYPGGYFHKPHTVFASRLQHAITVRIYKDGYTGSEMKITEGPFEWTALNGQNHGRYWLIKSPEIAAKLEPVSTVYRGAASPSRHLTSVAIARRELPLQEVVEMASPAVVQIESLEARGSGFFITDDGLIATNHHVVEGFATVDVVVQHETRLLGKVVYTDKKMDLAIVKVEGQGFPRLPLKGITSVHPGQTVIAIGNPAMGMANTVTKGIVSAIGPHPEAGKGTWIQTDAAINPGNSGGPLLNAQAEVIGLNTLKPLQSSGGIPLEGIGFALSSSDLIQVLQQVSPNSAASTTIPAPAGTGSVAISSEVNNAEIFVDQRFVGETPSTVTLSEGPHQIVVKAPGKKDWVRELEVMKDSQLTLHPVLEPNP